MPIDSWTDPVACGDVTVPPCPPLSDVNRGQNFLVGKADNCPANLIGPAYPAIGQSISSTNSELRTGSDALPIQTPLMRILTGLAVDQLNGQDGDVAGKQFTWKPPANCVTQRVVWKDELFQLIPDENPNIFDDACVGTYEEAVYLVGAIPYTDCNGANKIRLLMYPKPDASES